MKMRNFINKTLALVLVVSTLSSCLKDDSVVLNPDKGVNVIEFSNITNVAKAGSTTALYPLAFEILTTPQVIPVSVNYSGPATGAPEDIVVTIAVGNTSFITQYNTEQTGTYVALPSNMFSLSTTTLTIPKGGKKATFNVLVNTSLFDLSKAYVLPLTISKVSTGTISGNFGTILVAPVAKNKYDGIYSYVGTTVRNSAAGPDPALSGTFTGTNRTLVTLGANSNTIIPLWANNSGIGGIDNTYFTIDPATNLITMGSSNPTLKNTIGSVNKYDPATKTFTLNFDWGTAPSTRVVSMTLKYLGPRP
jgi:hypothetical protein